MAKRRYKRKRRGRKRPRRMKRRRVPRVLLGKSRLVAHKLVVATQLQVDTVAGLPVTITFRANSAANPMIGSTVQPNGFHELNSLFQDHTVVGCRITMTALPSAGQHARAFYVATELTDRFGSPSMPLNQVLAQRFCRYSVYSPGDGAGWKPRVTSTLSPKKFLDLKDYRDNQEVTGTGDSGNPTKLIYFNCNMAPTHTTPLQTCDVIFQLSYTILWNSPITPIFT